MYLGSSQSTTNGTGGAHEVRDPGTGIMQDVEAHALIGGLGMMRVMLSRGSWGGRGAAAITALAGRRKVSCAKDTGTHLHTSLIANTRDLWYIEIALMFKSDKGGW